ncbi:MAG: diaminopimelate decarboxylase [bacterium]
MQEFSYQSGKLYAEGVPVEELALRYGTPLYVYSRNHLRDRFRAIATAMADVKPMICYSVKANSNAAVIKTLALEGAGFDIVSGGELFRALRAGAEANKIVFAGVGKTREEIEYALNEEIAFFTCESEAEAVRISECAKRLGVKGRIAFRLNPDVDPKTHKYISTGKKENKFGLDLDRAMQAYATAALLPHIEIAGLHMHIGSQILSADPFSEALNKIKEVCRTLKATYPTFRFLDIGGGLGINYKPDQQALDPTVYAAALLPVLKELGLQVVLEPGRSIVGNAGILVCRVQYVKDSHFKKFIVTDGAMNDLIRPALYQAHHEILPVVATTRTVTGDLVGPICESGDFLAQDRELPDVNPGDLVVALSAGAYGFSMSSNYNSRPRAAEVMVDGTQATQIRSRETWEDIVRGENHV